MILLKVLLVVFSSFHTYIQLIIDEIYNVLSFVANILFYISFACGTYELKNHNKHLNSIYQCLPLIDTNKSLFLSIL